MTASMKNAGFIRSWLPLALGLVIADGKTQRLDRIVGLDDSQRDQVFGIMARGSSDYDPTMMLEGAAGGNIAASPAGTGRDAVLSVLRPDQRAA